MAEQDMTAREIWREIERGLARHPIEQYEITREVLWEIPGGLEGFMAAALPGYHVQIARESGNAIIRRHP